MFEKLRDKNVIITGASSGLGKEVAFKLASFGANVAIVARNESQLKDIEMEILKTYQVKVISCPCDIKDLNQIKSCIKSITNEFKQIDILVNNAGIWTDDEMEEKNPERRKEALETNALGNMNFTYEIVPILKKQSRGHIFNVISTAGTIYSPSGDNKDWKTYGASKWAMTGFTKALRASLLESKIKVSAFFPGGFESDLYEDTQWESKHDNPWMMKTSDVADAVVFALSRPDDVNVEEMILTKFR